MTICKQATIEGRTVRFTAASHTSVVIHPQAVIKTEDDCEIVVGVNNIIEERVQIRGERGSPITIGDDNLIQVGAVIEPAVTIGNGNVIEVRALIGRGTKLGNHCVVGAGCQTYPNEQIPDNHVVYCAPDGSRQVRHAERSTLMNDGLHKKHFEYLRELLPKYHHIIDAPQ